MSDYLRRSTPEQLKADISSVLDAACYTGVETAEDVCKKTVDLFRIANNSHEKEKLCQSRRHIL